VTESLTQTPVNPIVPANETERLAALHRYQVLDTPAEVAFDRITTLAARLFKKPIVLISLVDESRAWFKSSIGFGADEVCRNDALCNVAVLTDEPLIIPDTRLDDRFVCNPFVQAEVATRFYAGAPLLDRNGFNLGTLCLLDTVPHEALTAEEEATLVDLAAMVVDELELRLAAQKIASVDAALVEITQGVSRVTGGAFFDELVRHFAKVLGADYVYIGLVEGTEPKMMRTIATCDRGNIVENIEYRLQDTPCWEAILHGRGSANEQRKLCCYPRNVQARFPDAPLLKPLAVESYISIPFCGSDGSVLGLLGVMDGKPLVNVHLAESLLTIFASRIATELERQQNESILTEQTRLLEAVSTGQPLDECLSAMCSSISILSPHTRACVLLTDDRRTKFPRSIAPDFAPSLSQGLKDAPINELAIGTCSTAVYCGEPVTCDDIASDDRWSQKWRDLSIAHGIKACHSLPIMGIDNLPLGSVMLCFNEARLPTDWEYRLGKFGTKIASIAIERIRSIENLRESEERLNLALTGADMATWDADLATGKAIWSDKHFQLLGYEPTPDGAATVEMCMSRVHPDDRSSVMQAWETAQRKRSLFCSENRFVRADTGAVVWVSTTGRFIENYAGGAMRFVGVMFDISLRKVAAANLEQSNARFESAMLAVRGMVYEWHLQTQTVYRSAGLFDLMGIRAEDALPTVEWWAERVHPDDLERSRAEFLAAPTGIDRYEDEYRVRHAAGHWVYVLDRSYFQYDSHGKLTNVVGFTSDITDRKRAEADLRQNQALTQRQLGEIEAIYQTAPIGLAILDSDLRFERINHRLAEINGIAAEDHLGRTVREIVPDLADENEPLLRSVFTTGEPLLNIELSGETGAAPGVYRTWIENCYPLKDETGQSIGINVVVQEITDRKIAEAALAERNQELDSFVHTVSHDLKAPLRAISNLSVWIEEDLEGELPPDNQQQFQLLRSRVKRMESMIDSLLLYARAGRQEATLETFHLAELLHEIIDSLAPPESFRIEIQPPLPTLVTKRVFLSQVFANLLSNAIKHHTSETGHLHISAIEHPHYHEFIIKDDGPGIAPEHHEQVFAIFQTLKVKDNSDSTGIGLAIVKKIVETEAGTIRLESKLGQGTTFYITWPKTSH
jgi:PAS domain S-box-containing protein